MSELITTSSAYIINGDSPMTSVANTVAMTTFAVHTLHPYFLHATSTPRLPQYGTYAYGTMRIDTRYRENAMRI